MNRLLTLLLVLSFSLVEVALADVGRTKGVVGLLPLPEVFGNEPCEQFRPKDLEIFSAANESSRIGRIYVSRPWTFPAERGL